MGTFAFALVLDRTWLHFREKPTPLLAADPLAAFALRMLLRDDCADVREYRYSNRQEIRTPLLALPGRGIDSLRELCPELQAWQVVKAVGRLPEGPEPAKFLLGCLCDSSRDRRARLAAFSALTRPGYAEHRDLLRELVPELDRRPTGGPAWRLLETAGTDRDEPDPTEADGLAALRLIESRVRRLDEYADPWCTYSDLPYRLKSRVLDLRSVLPGAEADAILARIERHLAERK